MLLEFLKALLVGLCASAPLGPIAILVLQKSLSYGHRAGFATGLGATTVDTTYAIISIFAFAFAQSFLDKYENLVYIIGGIVVAGLGVSMAFKNPFRKLKADGKPRGASISDYFKAVGTALANPGAIFVMFALFAFFGLDIDHKDFKVIPIILAVASGSITYWFFFSWAFSSCRKAIDMKALVWLNRIAGMILMIIGIALLGGGLLNAFIKGRIVQ